MTMFLFGLGAPVVTLDQLFTAENTYSIVGGVIDLLASGDYLLAVLISAFSIVFPALKYGLLFAFVLNINRLEKFRHNLTLLRFLGKWSMLDTFVIAITFGAANLGVLSEVEVHWGIYLYGAGILLSMLVSLWLAWAMQQTKSTRVLIQPSPGNLDRILYALAFTCFMAGMLLPLVEIERWVFWERHYSITSALIHFVTAGEFLLPLVVLVFVILLPLIRFILVGMLRWRQSVHNEFLTLVEFVDEWAMFDVYMLALLLVLVKLTDSASVSLQAGFWLLVIAAMISVIDSIRIRSLT